MSFRNRYFLAMKELKEAYEKIEDLETQLGIAQAVPDKNIGDDYVVCKNNYSFIEAMRYAKVMSRERRPTLYHPYYGKFNKNAEGNFMAGVGYTYLMLQTLLNSEGWRVLEDKEVYERNC